MIKVSRRRDYGNISVSHTTSLAEVCTKKNTGPHGGGKTGKKPKRVKNALFEVAFFQRV